MKKVEVLLSAYNGEKHIQRQVESILNQKGVDIHISIRDDGSTDSTRDIIYRMQKQNPANISAFYGDNLNYKKSFLKLIRLAKNANYYAFSDQDDIWLPDKIIRAISCLEKIEDDIKLYASNVDVYNEKLEYIASNHISSMPKTIQSFYTRARIAGCTCVFSKQLKEIVEKFSELTFPDNVMPSHDFILGSCAFACGTVFIDEQCFIKHIRYNTSVTSGGVGLAHRIATEINILFCRKYWAFYTAILSLEKCKKVIKPNAIQFFEKIKNYKGSIGEKFALLADREMCSGMAICDAECKLKIILGRF